MFIIGVVQFVIIFFVAIVASDMAKECLDKTALSSFKKEYIANLIFWTMGVTFYCIAEPWYRQFSLGIKIVITLLVLLMGAFLSTITTLAINKIRNRKRK